MDKSNICQLVSKLEQSISLTQEVVENLKGLELMMSVAEMTKNITDLLGTGETAHRLRVDPSTVISWRNGHGITGKNLRKLKDFYDEERRLHGEDV